MYQIIKRKSPFLIAEIGINHNGDLNIAKKLIDSAADAGFDAVKFQKRNIEKVYSKEFLDSPRESPWGNTQRDQKLGLEFNRDEYQKIDKYCKEKNIKWSASALDLDSQEFVSSFKVFSIVLCRVHVKQNIYRRYDVP